MTAIVVSIINLKGGVGKSTLTMMLGEYLAFRYAKNVLFHNAKYSLTYRLTNPSSGSLSRKDEEGSEYRLEERIARLVEEFQERCR